MPKYFTEPKNINGDFLILTEEEARHIAVTMRMTAGEHITVCDGENNDYECEIIEADKNEIKAKILEKHVSDVEPKVKITLFQGLPKADKMELIIQKCVELGVCRIVPVATKRAVAKLEEGKKAEKKIERWAKISESAAKQSGRGIIPEVSMPMSFKEALNEALKLDIAAIPYENEKERGIRELSVSAKEKNCESIGIFIGPEGGFDEAEIELANEKGILPVTLGRRILRTETAGIVTSAILLYELD